MLHYKSILLATDLSAGTDSLTQTAADLAKRAQAKLSIIHVLEHTPVIYGGGEFSVSLDMSLEEQLYHNAKKALAVIAHRLQLNPEDLYVLHGSVKYEVIELAEKLGADLILVGSHGHGGMGFLLGSTANAILHAAKCDVLAVRVKI